MRKIVPVVKDTEKKQIPKRRAAKTILAAALLAALLAGAPGFAAMRPPSVNEILSREPADWSGVLSLGVVSTFPAAGSYTAFTGAAVKKFERANPGILIAVREMLPYSLREALASGCAPDVLLFGAGALDDPTDSLMPLTGGLETVRGEYVLAAMYNEQVYAAPVAVGGYVVIAHSDDLLKTGADRALDWPERLEGMAGKTGAMQCAARGYTYPAAALVALTGGTAAEYPQMLPANVGAVRRELAWPEFALEHKPIGYVAGPYELNRMRALQAGGRVAAWEVLPCEGAVYTDLLLLAGVVRPECAGRASAQDNARRSAAAGALVTAFLGEEPRAALTKLGLAPTTNGEPVLTGIYGLEQMEAQLAGEVVVPNVFTQRERIAAAQDGAAGARDFLLSIGWLP